MTCGCQKPYRCLLHAVRIEDLGKFVLAAEGLAEALENLFAMGAQYEWDKATTGRQILMADALSALNAWKEANK